MRGAWVPSLSCSSLGSKLSIRRPIPCCPHKPENLSIPCPPSGRPSHRIGWQPWTAPNVVVKLALVPTCQPNFPVFRTKWRPSNQIVLQYLPCAYLHLSAGRSARAAVLFPILYARFRFMDLRYSGHLTWVFTTLLLLRGCTNQLMRMLG